MLGRGSVVCLCHFSPTVFMLFSSFLKLAPRPAGTVIGPAIVAALRVTPLDHEFFDHAMEFCAVVESVFRKGDKVLDSFGRIFNKEFNNDWPFVGGKGCQYGLSLCLRGLRLISMPANFIADSYSIGREGLYCLIFGCGEVARGGRKKFVRINIEGKLIVL